MYMYFMSERPVIVWLEVLSYGAEGSGTDRKNVSQTVNGYLFQIREG